MKISEMSLPFKDNHGELTDAKEVHIAASCGYASELCSILNAHFAPKEHLKGICDKCVQPHDGSRIGRLCGIPGCGGKVVESIPFTEDAQPQPNRKETDAVAAKYYESGRKLEVQFWDSKQWTQGDWEGEGRFTPTFDYSLPWRIKPTKRRVVVDIYQDINKSKLSARISGDEVAPGKWWKFVGTIEGEVEA